MAKIQYNIQFLADEIPIGQAVEWLAIDICPEDSDDDPERYQARFDLGGFELLIMDRHRPLTMGAKLQVAKRIRTLSMALDSRDKRGRRIFRVPVTLIGFSSEREGVYW